MSFKSYITAWSDGTTFICPYCPDKVAATEHYEKEGRTVNYTTCPTCKEIMRQKKEEFNFEDVPTTTEIMKANALEPKKDICIGCTVSGRIFIGVGTDGTIINKEEALFLIERLKEAIAK